jgi:tetratricopeptide (TPR) repeat protein
VPTDTVLKIVQRLNPVVSKRLGVVLNVYGEPGIGKSWTIAQVLKSIPCQTLSVHAAISESGLVAALARPKKLATWAEKQLENLERGDFVDAPAIVNTLATTLAGLAPFVLHLEDVQETTPERFALIQNLALAIKRSKGLGLIVSSRSELPQPFQAFRIESLEHAESDALLMVELGSELPSEGLEYIFTRAQGNPLFTLEFLRYLTRQGFLWSDGKAWHWRNPPQDFMPVSLEALLEQIISNLVLDPQVQAALEARAMLVVPLEAVRQVWRQVSELSQKDFIQAKRSLEASGIVLNDVFSHPLIQEVIARAMPNSRRQVLAWRCWQQLEGIDAVLASRFIGHAGREHPEVLALLERAIIGATQSEQKAHLLALKVHWTPLAQRFMAALEAARALIDVDLKTAAQLAELAFSLHPDSLASDQLEALYLLVEIRLLERRLPEASNLLETLPDSERASLCYWQFSIRLCKESAEFRQAFERWQQRPEFHEHASPKTIHGLGWCIMETAIPEEMNYATDLISKTLTRDLSLQDRFLLLEARGNLLERLEQYASAASDFTQALEIASQTASHLWRAKLCNDLAQVLYIQDQNQEASTYIEMAYQIMLEHGQAFDLAHMQARLGVVFMETARFEKAESLMQKSREILQSSISLELCEVNLQLANLYLSWHTAHSAVLARWYASSGLKVARALAVPYTLCLAFFRAIQAETKFGEINTAKNLLCEFTASANELRLAGLQARLAWANALVAEASRDIAAALEHYQVAAKLFENLDDQSLLHQVQLEQDRCNQDVARAMEHKNWFMAHGLERLAQLVMRYFPETDKALEPLLNSIPGDSLQLRVLGAVSLEQHGKAINYRGRKRLEFLSYLLETRISGRNEAPTLEIIDALYPDLLEPEAKSALKQLVYLLRSKLGSDVIQSTPQGYALGAITSDAEQFLETGDPSLWHGVYLEGLSEGWLPGVRDALVQSIRQRIEGLAKTDTKQAARLGQILLEMDPYDRDTLELTLRAIGTTDPLSASLYRQAQVRFEQIGETLPNSSQAFLRNRDESISVD